MPDFSDTRDVQNSATLSDLCYAELTAFSLYWDKMTSDLETLDLAKKTSTALATEEPPNNRCSHMYNLSGTSISELVAQGFQ